MHYLSRVIRKLDFCQHQNKGTDQLCSNSTLDQCHFFGYTASTKPFYSLLYMSICADMVGNPEDGFLALLCNLSVPKLRVRLDKPESLIVGHRYKTFFMLNSAETKIYPAHKC